MTGTFNYHLKELNETGLIERNNGDYTITEAGKKTMIFVDEIARETKEEAKIDRYGVFSAVLTMQPKTELKLFLSNFGMIFGTILALAGAGAIVKVTVAARILEEMLGNNIIWLGGIALGLGILAFILSFIALMVIIWRIDARFSRLLFLGREWFFIRSPNRIRFYLLSFTIIGALVCLGFLTLSLEQTPMLILLVGFIVFTVLTIIMLILTIRKINKKEEKK